MVSAEETIDCYPLDGAYALAYVLEQRYGFVRTSRGNAMIAIDVEFGRTDNCPWGEFEVPGIEGRIYTGFEVKDSRYQFRITGRIRGKHKLEFQKIADETKVRVRTHSLYIGKALRIGFPDPDSDEFSPKHSPKFVDTSRVDASSLIFSDEVQSDLDMSLYTPIRMSEAVKRHKVPLKRGIVLAGEYGTGKTLVGTLLAQMCERHGWTMFYLDKIEDLTRAVTASHGFGRTLIFGEDADKIMNDRDADLEAAFDGFSSKAGETMIVLTTNHIDKIHNVYRRQGRVDQVITIQAPDARAAERMVRFYARGLIPANEDLAPVGKLLSGKIPAVIREVVERSKLAAISHTADDAPFTLSVSDLIRAATGMLREIAAMPKFQEDNRTDFEKLGTIIGAQVRVGMDRVRNGSNDSHSRARRALDLPDPLATLATEEDGGTLNGS